LGFLFVVGRFVFRSAYLKDPSSREIGFLLSFLPIAACLIGSIFFLIKSIV